ncbi:hypothetical protein KR084_005842 [Drosophila pseudotakahashii]|nr:hypothetical protein KR084_005842 [Drosophila pseudotakahashii]
MTTRRDDMAWISCGSSNLRMHPLLLLLLLLLPIMAAGFGNEYVHIKVHVPKEESPAEESSHKVIHHFHHHPHPHQLLRSRANRPRPKPSPLLESVILSDLDKPQHMSEHAEYLNHAKELADHLTETYAKKAAPPPPPPPKKKVNTYTIIEEQHRPHGYDYEDHHEPAVETYRVIESRPKQPAHHHHHHHQHLEAEEEEDVEDAGGYHYPSGGRHHHSSLGIGAYAEPAPVEEHVEHLEPDSGYSYSPPSHSYIPPSHSHSQAHRSSKSNRVQPAYTLEAPQESAYGYDYSRLAGGSSSDFRPSVQVPSSDPYGQEEEPVDSYGPPPPSATRRRPRPSSSLVDWPESKGFNSAAAETYSGVDSYNVGHVQGYGSGSSGYQYSGPYL